MEGRGRVVRSHNCYKHGYGLDPSESIASKESRGGITSTAPEPAETGAQWSLGLLCAESNRRQLRLELQIPYRDDPNN